MKIKFLFLVTLALMVSVSCSKPVPDPKPEDPDTPVVDPDKPDTPDPETPDTPDTPEPRKGTKILFTGNSLTYYGEVIISPGGSPSQDPGIFEKIAKSKGVTDLTVTNFCYGGAGYVDGRDSASKDGLPSTYSDYGIYQLLTYLHPNYYGKGETMDDIYDQDYVFLQQRGSNLSASYEQAKKVMALFPPTVKFLVMTTHYDYKNSNVYQANKKLHDADGVTVIPWGDLVTNVWNNQIYGMDFTYKKADFVITKDDVHPNYLAGYIAAQMSYCAIYGGSAVGSDYSFVKRTIGSYYTSEAQTQFPQVLANASEMEKIQKLIDGFLAGKSISEMHFAEPPVSTEDNVLKGITLLSDDHFSPSWSPKNVASLTDGITVYGGGSNYADFKWVGSAAAAKAPTVHYNEQGVASETGKYLCGFTLNLGQTVKVDSLTFFNQRNLMDINGFDILVSTDNSNWTVVFSGEKLTTGCKYSIFDESTNYIGARFPAIDAKYVRFGLTEPRAQVVTEAEIAAFNEKYGTPTSGSGPNANPNYFRIVEIEMFKAK